MNRERLILRVVFTPRAIRHLEALHDHLCDKASDRIADGYVGRIVSACQKLSLFPERGTRRDEVLPGLRTIVSNVGRPSHFSSTAISF